MKTTGELPSDDDDGGEDDDGGGDEAVILCIEDEVIGIYIVLVK